MSFIQKLLNKFSLVKAKKKQNIYLVLIIVFAITNNNLHTGQNGRPKKQNKSKIRKKFASYVLHRTQKKRKQHEGTDVNELKKINSTQQGVYVKEVKNYKKVQRNKNFIKRFSQKSSKERKFPKAVKEIFCSK